MQHKLLRNALTNAVKSFNIVLVERLLKMEDRLFAGGVLLDDELELINQLQ